MATSITLSNMSASFAKNSSHLGKQDPYLVQPAAPLPTSALAICAVLLYPPRSAALQQQILGICVRLLCHAPDGGFFPFMHGILTSAPHQLWSCTPAPSRTDVLHNQASHSIVHSINNRTYERVCTDLLGSPLVGPLFCSQG